MPEKQTVRCHFIDETERIVEVKDMHWVGEEGSKSAIALVDGREVPIYRRSDWEMWEEQLTYEQWKQQESKEAQ